MTNPTPETHLPLRPVVLEMLLILNEKELHGYGLMKEVSERTDGRFSLGPGTLYRTLNELEDSGIIAETGRRPAPDAAGRTRVYYGITPYGKRVASAEAERLARLVKLARSGNLLAR